MRKRICAFAVLVAGTLSVSAATAPSPYGIIAAHNSFRLQPAVTPPPPAERARPLTASAPAVEVTGITSVGGLRRALLEISEAGRLLGKPVLAEGGAEWGVEVLRIDVETCQATARVQGVETLLPLRKGRSTQTSPGPRLP